MKVFILACLVALALAKEESTEHTDEKFQMVEEMQQLQAKDVLQNKIPPFIQSQPQAFPYDQPISCTPIAQNAQPIAQPPVVPSLGPVISPDLENFLKAKATILPKTKAIPYVNAETVLRLASQVFSTANLANQHIPQAQAQLLAQVLQAFPQTPVVSAQAPLSVPHSKVLYFLQQVAPFLQSDMAVQALLQYLDLLLNSTLLLPSNQSLHQVTMPPGKHKKMLSRKSEDYRFR
ncbi:beta-casein [Peromyscus californicus insignis]|uniref:beta-casein n=1 Tax=Peromyscus californicus insignis TaxID=564181 RepID=UPI0022A67069|nr:beta-casein [Peromyscus californicus insignis]